MINLMIKEPSTGATGKLLTRVIEFIMSVTTQAVSILMSVQVGWKNCEVEVQKSYGKNVIPYLFQSEVCKNTEMQG